MTVTHVQAVPQRVAEPPPKGPVNRGVHGKRKQTLVESKAVLDAATARRLKLPVMVTGVTVADTITVIQPGDFGKLNIDEKHYQRMRIGPEVNTLIMVLKGGGAIPDPIDVSERPDKSWWIVDGQQRFWAHDECKMPIKAHIHKVEDVDAEARLFFALNARRRLLPRTLVKGWPGPAGEFIRRMNESPSSPVRGMIDLNNSSNLPLDGPAVIKGILIAMTGLEHANGDMATSVLPRTDAALKVTGRPAWAEAFVNLLAAVFGMKAGAGRVRVLPIMALARVANRKYTAVGRPVFPKSCARLRKVNWDTIVPSHAAQFLPILENEIERRWK